MWLEKLFPPTPVQKLTESIQELIVLIRLDLASRGVPQPLMKLGVDRSKIRKRTAADVTITTREDLVDQQRKDEIEAELATKRPDG